MSYEPANGTEIVLIKGIHNIFARRYRPDGTFTDYTISHYDKVVKINDSDVYFYEENGGYYLDHSPKTLGIC